MVDEKLVQLLEGIKEDTAKIVIIEEKLKRLEKLEEDFDNKTINTVKNNNSLSEFFKKMSKEETVNYLNSQEARTSLIATIKEIFIRELNLKLVKILAWQGSILTTIFIIYVNVWVR